MSKNKLKLLFVIILALIIEPIIHFLDGKGIISELLFGRLIILCTVIIFVIDIVGVVDKIKQNKINNVIVELSKGNQEELPNESEKRLIKNLNLWFQLTDIQIDFKTFCLAYIVLHYS